MSFFFDIISFIDLNLSNAGSPKMSNDSPSFSVIMSVMNFVGSLNSFNNFDMFGNIFIARSNSIDRKGIMAPIACGNLYHLEPSSPLASEFV